jgi:hypothetical protein
LGKDELLDEKILEMINKVEKPAGTAPLPEQVKKQDDIPPQERTIYTGIKVSGGNWVEFAERLFVENKLAMMVPVEFTEMDQESAKLKYPMEQRPGTIFTDSTGEINILFSNIDEQITNDDVVMIRDKMLAMMVKMNPGIKPQSTGEKEISGKNIAYTEFTHPTIDGKLYNLMYFLELDGKTLMGIFNCLTKTTKYWKQAAFEMMQSIRVIVPAKEE